MKIAWFTPFSQKSSIGRFSQGVTSALAKHASVDIITFDSGPTHASDVPIRKFKSAAAINDQTLAGYDVYFYNFGNHLQFHLDIFNTSRRFPGIAVMHDFVMHHFFAGYYIDIYRSREDYLNVLDRLYGKKLRDAAAAFVNKPGPPFFWDSDQVAECPLFEEALGGAQGVVAHSEFFKDRISQVFGGPLCKIPLHHKVDRDSPVPSRKQLGVADDRLLILTVGHANPNKRITSTIDALGKIRDKLGPFEFVVAGLCSRDYRKEIDAAIARNRLDGIVKVLGEVSYEALRGYLTAADICVNLRFPVTEGASGSAIEQMMFSKPVIVSNIGFYAELPDDCVTKVDPNSPHGLQDALITLASNPAERTRLGAAARLYADAEFNATHYADLALRFAEEVRRARPMMQLVDSLAHESSRMGFTQESGIVQVLSNELTHLFGKLTG